MLAAQCMVEILATLPSAYLGDEPVPPINLTVASPNTSADPIAGSQVGILADMVMIVSLCLIIAFIIKSCRLRREMIIRTAVSLS